MRRETKMKGKEKKKRWSFTNFSVKFDVPVCFVCVDVIISIANNKFKCIK